MRSRAQIYISGSLTWIAGFVDAAGFLALLQIYTANMSGNSVAFGIQLWNQNWVEALRRGWPVAIYVIGSLIGRILLEIGARLKIRPMASIAFCIEIALLLPVSVAHSLVWSESASLADFAFIGLLALAMGIQNATLTRFSSLTLHTGFVTGTLLKFAEQFTKYLTWCFDEMHRHGMPFTNVLRKSGRQKDFQLSVWLGSVWAAYVIGAICGAAAHSAIDLKCLFVPIAGLAILALIDLQNPLAVKEEEEQNKLP